MRSVGLKYTHYYIQDRQPQGPSVYQSNYTQYLAVTYNGRKCKKGKKSEYMYMYN